MVIGSYVDVVLLPFIPVFVLEFLMSSSSPGRDVVVWSNSVFRISESPYFGGCGISFWRTTLFLLRWSIALCW